MKRFVALAMVALFSLAVITSCGKVIVNAPAGKTIKLGSGAITSPTAKKKVFYLFWGLVPLGDNTTANMMGGVPDGGTVIVEDKTTFVDALLTGILGGGIVTVKTVEVQVQ